MAWRTQPPQGPERAPLAGHKVIIESWRQHFCDLARHWERWTAR